jgi:hypothetical protein
MTDCTASITAPADKGMSILSLIGIGTSSANVATIDPIMINDQLILREKLSKINPETRHAAKQTSVPSSVLLSIFILPILVPAMAANESPTARKQRESTAISLGNAKNDITDAMRR